MEKRRETVQGQDAELQKLAQGFVKFIVGIIMRQFL